VQLEGSGFSGPDAKSAPNTWGSTLALLVQGNCSGALIALLLAFVAFVAQMISEIGPSLKMHGRKVYLIQSATS
jgi:hypothetical protein